MILYFKRHFVNEGRKSFLCFLFVKLMTEIHAKYFYKRNERAFQAFLFAFFLRRQSLTKSAINDAISRRSIVKRIAPARTSFQSEVIQRLLKCSLIVTARRFYPVSVFTSTLIELFLIFFRDCLNIYFPEYDSLRE